MIGRKRMIEGGDKMTDVRKVNKSWSKETMEAGGTDHPVCIVLERPRDHVRVEQSACWQCGNVSHIRRNCQLGHCQVQFTGENDRQKAWGQEEETKKEATGSTLVPCHYMLSMCHEDSHDILHVNG
jgi:hypothetical protein